jgi:RimJ/RimL family protein N-acetyltransferase
MIEGKASKPLGHMGIKSLNSDCAEVDSVMKSPQQTARGLMDRCLNALIDFAKNDLGVKELRLEVASNNNRAIDLYLRNDFIETHRFPLQRVQTGESISHRKVNPEDSNVDFFALTMSRKLGSES